MRREREEEGEDDRKQEEEGDDEWKQKEEGQRYSYSRQHTGQAARPTAALAGAWYAIFATTVTVIHSTPQGQFSCAARYKRDDSAAVSLGVGACCPAASGQLRSAEMYARLLLIWTAAGRGIDP